MKHSFKEKLNVVNEITWGKGLNTISRQRHLDKLLVCGWIARFRPDEITPESGVPRFEDPPQQK